MWRTDGQTVRLTDRRKYFHGIVHAMHTRRAVKTTCHRSGFPEVGTLGWIAEPGGGVTRLISPGVGVGVGSHCTIWVTCQIENIIIVVVSTRPKRHCYNDKNTVNCLHVNRKTVYVKGRKHNVLTWIHCFCDGLPDWSVSLFVWLPRANVDFYRSFVKLSHPDDSVSVNTGSSCWSVRYFTAML